MDGLSVIERNFLQDVIDAALVEAFERQVGLTPAEITLRLICAYERGLRNLDELKDAIVFNDMRVYLQ